MFAWGSVARGVELLWFGGFNVACKLPLFTLIWLALLGASFTRILRQLNKIV